MNKANQNPLHQLQLLVNATEKLYLLPPSEITGNGKMMTEIKNAFSSHNIDGILNNIRNEMIEARNMRPEQTIGQDQLLNAYAQREHDKVVNSGKDWKPYVTEIVNATPPRVENSKKPSKIEPLAATKKADDKFLTVFNSVYSVGALEVNTAKDPTTLMSYIDYSPYRANYKEYLSVPTLSEMCDRPLAIALKKFPEVNSENDKFNKAIIKAIKKKKIKHVIKDAMFYSLLSPRGSIVVPIQRGDEVTFNVFNDTQFAYGMGSSYSGITQPYDPMRVGELYCMGAKLRHGVSAFFTCPGYEPLFGVGLNRLPQLRTAAEAWNLYVHVVKYLLIRAQTLIQKLEGDIQTDTMLGALMAKVDRMSQNMGVSTPVTQARGMTLDILNNNIGPGTSDVAPVIQSFGASVSGMSPEYMYGGGNANYSQASFQIFSTNENIHSRYQVGQIDPLLRYIVNTMIKYDKEIASFGVEEDDFEIKFENIYEGTEQEKVEIIGKKTEILIRQCQYPELETAFKQEKLLADDITLPKIKEPDPKDNNPNKIDDDSETSVLQKPLA